MEPDYRAAIRPFVDGRPILAAFEAATGAVEFAARLRELGALRTYLIAGSRGQEELPVQKTLPHSILGISASSVMDGFRAFDAALADLGDDVVASVNTFDPDGDALVLTAPSASVASIAQRPVFGARPADWLALEDKLVADRIWQETDTPHAIYRHSSVSMAGLLDAFESLDSGRGMVVTGDNKEGWHGGGEYVRWARTPGDVPAVLDYFEHRSDRVRVMPFLDGIPCSIHGLVVPHRTLTFRPVEMVVLRRQGNPVFQYAGMATAWDPREEDRTSMKKIASRVGEYLRRSVGYRGAFSIDGVMTAAGFRPTELNPRLSGGFAMQASAIEDLPAGLVNRALAAGHLLDIDWDALEQKMVLASDKTRRGRSTIPLGHLLDVDHRSRVRWESGRWIEDQPGTATIATGSGIANSMLWFTPDPGSLPVGSSVAPMVCEAIAFANDRWHVGAGHFEAAPDLRPK
ncbi:MAG: hypothetical protein JJE47_15085 [Acidimicrobiia bacterium]|nr:hypothetical protein [Acidimicrobiia bacterium]